MLKVSFELLTLTAREDLLIRKYKYTLKKYSATKQKKLAIDKTARWTANTNHTDGDTHPQFGNCLTKKQKKVEKSSKLLTDVCETIAFCKLWPESQFN